MIRHFRVAFRQPVRCMRSVREGVVGNAEVMPKPYERPDDVRS